LTTKRLRLSTVGFPKAHTSWRVRSRSIEA
jgi:hypothetical protein